MPNHPHLDRLKQEAEENPLAALGVGAVVITSIAKLLDSLSSARSKNAYAKAEKRRSKAAHKK